LISLYQKLKIHETFNFLEIGAAAAYDTHPV
jgi:hypothetical protein